MHSPHVFPMKITLSTITPDEALYSTVGDWRFNGDNLNITTASHLPSKHYERLILLHELVEAMICDARGIPEQAVTDFDIQHPELAEPGDSLEAPYNNAHFTAMSVERMVASAMGVSWHQHDLWIAECSDAVDAALDKREVVSPA